MLSSNYGVVVRSYSGRGMYGKHCLGVYWEGTISEFVSFAMFTIHNHIDDNKEKLSIFESFAQMMDRPMNPVNYGDACTIFFPNIPFDFTQQT